MSLPSPARGKGLAVSILSLSLLTVMAGAAVAPALGVIQAYFSGTSQTVVQLIISIPALFIVITNLCFPALSRRFSTKTLVLGGICCGTALFAASAAQQMGIGTTSTAKAGFMTALYVVLVPLLGVFFGRRPGVKLGICACISLAGLYLLCLAGHDTLTLTGGEWMLLLCSLLFAFQIMLVDHYSPRLDGVQLSFAEFFATAVLSTIFMFVFETPTFAQIQGAAVSIAYCGILSSGVAYTLQIVGQKELDPTIASMAMCMESVFSALAGWLILGQTLSGVELAGCALMFAAIIGAQIPEKVRS